MRLRSAAAVYFSLYFLGAGGWALFKISAGCPCGWIADCIQCSSLGGFLESFAAWGVVALVIAIPIVLLVLVIQFLRKRVRAQ